MAIDTKTKKNESTNTLPVLKRHLTELSEEDEESKATHHQSPHKMPKLAQAKSTKLSKLSIVKRISREDIRLVYTMEKILGSGNFGTARLAHKTGIADKNYAIKSI